MPSAPPLLPSRARLDDWGAEFSPGLLDEPRAIQSVAIAERPFTLARNIAHLFRRILSIEKILADYQSGKGPAGEHPFAVDLKVESKKLGAQGVILSPGLLKKRALMHGLHVDGWIMSGRDFYILGLRIAHQQPTTDTKDQ